MLPPTIQPRQQTKYKRPRRLNTVSITLMLIMGAIVYFVYFTWPIYTLRLRAKGELEEMLPLLWRANLVSGPDRIIQIRNELVDRLRKVGVKDPKLKVVVERSKAIVALEAHFIAASYYPWIDKTHIWQMAPRAQTDAARVEW